MDFCQTILSCLGIDSVVHSCPGYNELNLELIGKPLLAINIAGTTTLMWFYILKEIYLQYKNISLTNHKKLTKNLNMKCFTILDC